MNKLHFFLKKKWFIYLLCALPFLWLLLQLRDLSPFQYPFWSSSLSTCGYSAALLLALSLTFAPMSRHLAHVELFKILNRHKREVGLSAFYYAIFHVISYYVKKILKYGMFPWDSLLNFYVLFGELAFLILLSLALTSNLASQKHLTYPRWKCLHRSVYLAEGAIFLHMALQGSDTVVFAFLIFIPLVLIQRLRIHPSHPHP